MDGVDFIWYEVFDDAEIGKAFFKNDARHGILIVAKAHRSTVMFSNMQTRASMGAQVRFSVCDVAPMRARSLTAAM